MGEANNGRVTSGVRAQDRIRILARELERNSGRKGGGLVIGEDEDAYELLEYYFFSNDGCIVVSLAHLHLAI